MKLREGDSWMSADEYGRSLSGMGINLLVTDMSRALIFQRDVLAAEVVYSDRDFAVLRGYGTEWMLHADHTYNDHPLSGSLTPEIPRGVGIELRLHHCDPDQAEARARAGEHTVLAGALDKPHGLREVYIVDPDGYVWVPDVPVVPSP